MWLQIFLGALREAEVERVNQRISQAIIETCLAMTIFRDEFNIKFVALFTIQSFIKVFHWLVQDRCDPHLDPHLWCNGWPFYNRLSYARRTRHSHPSDVQWLER